MLVLMKILIFTHKFSDFLFVAERTDKKPSVPLGHYVAVERVEDHPAEPVHVNYAVLAVPEFRTAAAYHGIVLPVLRGLSLKGFKSTASIFSPLSISSKLFQAAVIKICFC